MTPTFKHLCSVEAVEDGVEHDLWVVAVGVELGAEALGVWNDPGVLPNNRVGRGLSDFDPALGGPGPVLKVGFVTKRLVVDRRRVQTWKK